MSTMLDRTPAVQLTYRRPHAHMHERFAGLQVSDSFPFKWINKKWKEGFYVTSMATSHTRWAVVMSRNAGFIDQCVELDFQYPSEGIHRRWDAGGGEPACHASRHLASSG